MPPSRVCYSVLTTSFAAQLCAPKLETELLAEATEILIQFPASDAGGFSPPTIEEFFPPAILFEGTIFEMNRIVLVRLFAVVALFLVFWLGTRKMRVIPGRFQGVVEMGLSLVRVNIAEDLLGEKDGKRFLPLLTTIFFLVLFMNLTGVIPGINIAGTSVIGMPLVLAVASYLAFIYAGLRKHPGAFLKNSLLPPRRPLAAVHHRDPHRICLHLSVAPGDPDSAVADEHGGRPLPARTVLLSHPFLRPLLWFGDGLLWNWNHCLWHRLHVL